MGILSFFKSKEYKKDKLSVDLSDFMFVSSNLSKYEKGVETANIDGCWKGIEINKDSKNDNSYSMTIRKLDKQITGWGTDVQMYIKQMKIKAVSDNKLELNGYGNDEMGVSFSDYGITLLFEKNVIVKVILKFFYRNTELHYSR